MKKPKKPVPSDASPPVKSAVAKPNLQTREAPALASTGSGGGTGGSSGGGQQGGGNQVP
jgi:hypothetical protein